jgi:hypothetical protein
MRRKPENRANPAWLAEGAEALADDAAAEADGDRMGARARLKLGQQMPDVRLDRLLRQEQPDADLAIHEAVRDELEHLDLAHRRLLLELAKRALERDHLGTGGGAPARGDLFEAPRMIRVAGHDLFALSSVHGLGIGRDAYPL